MNTTFVGIKDFRQDVSGYAKKARSAKTRFVVVNRNKPLFEVTPFAESPTHYGKRNRLAVFCRFVSVQDRRLPSDF